MFISLNAFAQSPQQMLANGYVQHMAARAKFLNVPYMSGEIHVDSTLKQAASYELKKNHCFIRVNTTFMQHAIPDEIYFAITIQYAHCQYHDPHEPKSEADAWHRVYRADAFASKMYDYDGLEVLCKRRTRLILLTELCASYERCERHRQKESGMSYKEPVPALMMETCAHLQRIDKIMLVLEI